MNPEKALPARTTAANVKANPASRPHRVTVRLSDEALAALDQEIALEGREGRAELVERLLREHVERRKRERLYLEQANQTVTTESGRQVRVYSQVLLSTSGAIEESLAKVAWLRYQYAVALDSSNRSLFTVENEVAWPLTKVSVLETRNSTVKHRVLAIEKFCKELDGTWRPADHICFSRSLLPWLIDALQSAEAAIQAESSRNRKKAQEVRASRGAEEVAREAQSRATYIEWYSRARVNKAVTLADRHRARAERVNLTEHFTPWQWLDLCARSDFRCISCGVSANLEPHHRAELIQGGPNTIANIDPLCRSCHRNIPLEPHEIAELWEMQQKRLLESFNVGDRVRPEHSNAPPGEILEIFPACRGTAVPSKFHGKEVRWYGKAAHDWAAAKACVSWPWRESFRQTTVEFNELVKVE